MFANMHVFASFFEFMNNNWPQLHKALAQLNGTPSKIVNESAQTQIRAMVCMYLVLILIL